jgi:hypothetical protein
MALPEHPLFAGIDPKRIPEAHRKISETWENKVALFEPAAAMIETLGKPLVMTQQHIEAKYHHGWDVDAIQLNDGTELPTFTEGQQDTKLMFSEVTMIRGGFNVSFSNILQEISTSQDSSISPTTDSVLTAFERNADRNLDVFAQLMGRWFLRGDFNVDGRLSAAKEAKLLPAIRGVTTIWGEDSTNYTPRAGITRAGLLQFASPAAQAASARAPFGLTKYVGTDDDMGWYNEHVECLGPDTVHKNLQRLAARMSRDPHYLSGHVPDVAYADDETIIQLAESLENKVLHVMDAAAPMPGLQRRSADLVVQFAKEFGRATHIMQFGAHKLPVYNTPAYIYANDTKIQELGGIMVALCTQDWRRLQFANVLNNAIATGGIKFFPKFADSQFAVGDFVQDPYRRFLWQQDWMYVIGHLVEQLRTHFTVKGTVAVDEV